MLTRSQHKLQEQNAATVEAQCATIEADVEAVKKQPKKKTPSLYEFECDFIPVGRALKAYLDEMEYASTVASRMIIVTEILRRFNDFFQKYDVLPSGHRLNRLLYTVYNKVITFANEYCRGAWSNVSDSIHAPLREIMNVSKQLSSKHILNYSGDDLAINTLKQSLQNQSAETR